MACRDWLTNLTCQLSSATSPSHPIRRVQWSRVHRYSSLFEAAVETASKSIRSAVDNGYRFGLSIAPGMGSSDFEMLDNPKAVSELQHLIVEWSDDYDLFSWEFSSRIQAVLTDMANGKDIELKRLSDELLGVRDDGAVGVIWTKGEDEKYFPRVITDYAEGIVAALRDVRDEAVRRLRASSTPEASDE